MTNAQAMRWLARTKGRKRPGKFPKIEPALKAQERDYLRQMMPMLKKMNELVGAYLIPAIKSASEGMNRRRPAGVRTDAPDDDLREAMKKVRIAYARDFTEDEIRRMAEKRGMSIAQMNREFLNRGVRKVLDIDVIASEPHLAEELSMWGQLNANLIGSMADTWFDKVESLAYDGVTSGLNWEDIRDEVFDMIDPELVKSGNIRARAELIARDQVGKLNGQLDMVRQTDIGVTRYIWRTVGDERVRETHQQLNGQEFTWDEPPITNAYGDRNHPGEDYQCRCYAEPILADLTDDEDEAAGAALAAEDEG